MLYCLIRIRRLKCSVQLDLKGSAWPENSEESMGIRRLMPLHAAYTLEAILSSSKDLTFSQYQTPSHSLCTHFFSAPNGNAKSAHQLMLDHINAIGGINYGLLQHFYAGGRKEQRSIRMEKVFRKLRIRAAVRWGITRNYKQASVFVPSSLIELGKRTEQRRLFTGIQSTKARSVLRLSTTPTPYIPRAIASGSPDTRREKCETAEVKQLSSSLEF
ncbi:hypothetical protein T265_09520 [Opisthorchis viverrini]|uniref:Uncharacterized protein n=1 Tax=Opisthorchis viverrini TaxID=6198 RepID=A0A074ZGK3_OPIVI|nr:hypothetical protein T265_09520 [Opisthorchis viverrini]KER22380.1 hypothetical protein T265_09520 [Opisthorchis viverrini]